MRKNVHVRSYRERWSHAEWQRLANLAVAQRDAMRMSQNELAAASGLSQRTIAAVEAAEGVSLKTLHYLEGAFGWERGSAERFLAAGITPVARPTGERSTGAQAGDARTEFGLDEDVIEALKVVSADEREIFFERLRAIRARRDRLSS